MTTVKSNTVGANKAREKCWQKTANPAKSLLLLFVIFIISLTALPEPPAYF